MNADAVDDELRAALERLATARPVHLSADPLAEVYQRVRARRVKRRLPVVIAMAAGIVIALAVTRVFLAGGDQSKRIRAGRSHPPPTTTAPLIGGIKTLDPGPLAPRRNAAVVWSGHELVVWGGVTDQFVSNGKRPYQSYTDGAA